MALESLFDLPLLTYSRARSAGFMLEYQLLNALRLALPGTRKGAPNPDARDLPVLEKELLALLKRDSENIRKKVYPLSVLRPESPFKHLLRFPRLLADGYSISKRQKDGRTTVFTSKARDFLGELPRYYRRNFHYQTDGYLSERSAELYEHQVELLFGGTADAMRRLALPPMRKALSSMARAGRSSAFDAGQREADPVRLENTLSRALSHDGRGMRLLEIGAGTGRGTRFARLAFPKAKIVATDLSGPYLKVAQRQLSQFDRIDYLQADGTGLPFRDGSFEAVFSIFLFHELPMAARRAVVAEARRVLKPGGFFVWVDSLQTGDLPAMDGLLEKFPESYHEPFYRDYIAHPMEELMKSEGFREIETDRGFLSKVCWGEK